MRHLPHVLARATDRNQNTVFKASFWLLYPLMLGSALLSIFLVWYTTEWMKELPKEPLAFWGVGILTAFLSIPAAFIIASMWRIEINADTLSSTDYWGLRLTYTWAEIEQVERVKVLGLPTLKVTSFRTKRPPIYMPLFIVENEALRARVIATVSPVNPFRIALESKTWQATRVKSTIG